MSWFLIALIGPVLYAITNHTDKYLLEKYFKGGEAGAIILFSALFSVFVLPIVYIIEPAVFSLGGKEILALILSGMSSVVCVILYLKSLQDDEASIVVPFFQTIPVFGFILGYFILGETLTFEQIAACVLIIFGALILSLSFDQGKFSVKKRVAGLMLGASFLFAISGVIFKLIAINDGFWISIFWEFSGRTLLGILIFIFAISYRKQFIYVLRHNKMGAISLNSLNETLFILGDGFSVYATLLAPIALVMTVNGFQPVFVFIFGIILTLFFPKLGEESLSKKDLAQKILGIGIITIGTYLLGMTGAL